MLQEYTWCAWHCQHESICSKCILLDRILLSIRAFLGIVVFNKRHAITAIVLSSNDTRITQFGPSATDGISHGITEGEVEGGTLHLIIYFCTINPVLHFRSIAVPIFAYREFGVRISVVHTSI